MKRSSRAVNSSNVGGARRSAPICCDYNNLLVSAVGAGQGVSEKELERLVPRIGRYHQETVEERATGLQAFCQLPYDRKPLRQVAQQAERFRERFENLVVLGIGGSALGNVALHSALRHPFYNELPRDVRKAPRLYVMDNVDPVRLTGLFDLIDTKETLFNVITKSGSTAETVAQFLIVRDMLAGELGSSYGEHIVVTTAPSSGPLRKLVEQEGWSSFAIPPGVGGRFSVLSPVGLFSAAVTGIDVRALLAGARAMDRRCSQPDLWQNPAYMGAALNYLLYTKKGKPILVMMPYSHALRDLADWFRQLWAESLGKRLSLQGKVVSIGSTPVKALGVTDQHSQMQLYMEGPCDKVITLLAVERFDEDVPIPRLYPGLEAIGYLGGHRLAELFRAERQATTWALTKAHRPNATFTFPKVSAHTVGQFIFLMEVMTAFMGKLLQINPFDQPGVELGKQATYELMGRPGYQELRTKLSSKSVGKSRWVL